MALLPSCGCPVITYTIGGGDLFSSDRGDFLVISVVVVVEDDVKQLNSWTDGGCLANQLRNIVLNHSYLYKKPSSILNLPINDSDQTNC